MIIIWVRREEYSWYAHCLIIFATQPNPPLNHHIRFQHTAKKDTQYKASYQDSPVSDVTLFYIVYDLNTGIQKKKTWLFSLATITANASKLS